MPIGFSSGRLSLGTSLPKRNTASLTGRITSVMPIAYLSVLSCCVQLGSQGLSIALNQKETNCAQQ